MRGVVSHVLDRGAAFAFVGWSAHSEACADRLRRDDLLQHYAVFR